MKFHAGLDVYDVEPLPTDHELRKLSKIYNVILTPHLGYVSAGTYKFSKAMLIVLVGFYLEIKSMS